MRTACIVTGVTKPGVAISVASHAGRRHSHTISRFTKPGAFTAYIAGDIIQSGGFTSCNSETVGVAMPIAADCNKPGSVTVIVASGIAKPRCLICPITGVIGEPGLSQVSPPL